ncbi:spore photoproduct lyase family protein [Fusobacterium pseudoperiodonticum]|uniref:spore photoproduct lyase family protein n=1 Tax=Fusobacterium pseudoperiodonticum TaxID=2663009 RepID=UPI000C1BD1FF|nr:spore photoproduct lyase [Fusobacterium pseudoperiodonticum]ATV56395.1 spore photoproduct lyase [Fusobacterium pseudoperiodonticum]
MLYIVTALYIEAKPLISLFNLKKDNSYTKFQVFSNEDIKLIISGTGKVKSATALTYLISKEDIKKNDYIVNIGFVASNKNSQLGDIVYVSKIQNAYSDFDFYPEMIYKHNFLEGSLTTFDSIVEKKLENIEYIDMEAYGFFQTASIFFKKDKIIVLKIVSDILKDKVEDRVLVDFKNENLFTESYNNIYKFLVNFKTVNDDSDFTITEQELIKKVLENLRLSDTMTYELFNILRYLKIKYGSIDILKKYEDIEVTSKVQAKKLFEEIKNISLQKNSLEKTVSPEINKKKIALNNRFSHIYVEKKILDNKNTLEILSKFKDAKIIKIDNYKEVFSSNNQDFHLQKLGQNLILASNKPNMIYEGAVVCEDFENDNFYYTSSIINCVYDCEYCYLQGVYSSGNIVIFVDIEKVFEEVEELYNKLKSLYLCVSYDTDLLAIENICSFSEKWYHFIKDKKDLKIELRTKSGNIDKFLNLDVLDNFIIAFTLSPEEIALKNEKYTAGLKNRVKAIKELQNKGWKVRICIDPLIYTDDFEKNYSEMIEYLFSKIDKNKVIDVSIGVFRTSKEYLKKMRNQNKKSEILYYPFECTDGVYTYSDKLKSYMIDFIKEQFLKYINIERIY